MRLKTFESSHFRMFKASIPVCKFKVELNEGLRGFPPPSCSIIHSFSEPEYQIVYLVALFCSHFKFKNKKNTDVSNGKTSCATNAGNYKNEVAK